MSASRNDSSAIVSRMRELRSTGQSDVAQLHAQAERVTDWREHVRAQPILTAVSSTVVGYLVVRALVGNSTSVQTVAFTSPAQVANKTKASMGLLSLVGGIATSVGRQWVTEYLKKQLGVNAHAAKLIPSNGRTRVPELPFTDDLQPVSQSDVADKLNQVLRDHPGTIILVGLAVGGLLGWLTSRQKR